MRRNGRDNHAVSQITTVLYGLSPALWSQNDAGTEGTSTLPTAHIHPNRPQHRRYAYSASVLYMLYMYYKPDTYRMCASMFSWRCIYADYDYTIRGQFLFRLVGPSARDSSAESPPISRVA